MSQMLSGCYSLHDISVAALNTENVRDMSGMFACCTLLEKIEVDDKLFQLPEDARADGMFERSGVNIF